MYYSILVFKACVNMQGRVEEGFQLFIRVKMSISQKQLFDTLGVQLIYWSELEDLMKLLKDITSSPQQLKFSASFLDLSELSSFSSKQEEAVTSVSSKFKSIQTKKTSLSEARNQNQRLIVSVLQAARDCKYIVTEYSSKSKAYNLKRTMPDYIKLAAFYLGSRITSFCRQFPLMSDGMLIYD